MPRKRKHSCSDSDSDWEPPAKRKKLNSNKTVSKTKTHKRSVRQPQTPTSKPKQIIKRSSTKRQTRKCRQQPSVSIRAHEKMDIDSDSDIEILCNVSNESYTKKRNITNKAKTKTKTKAKKTKTKEKTRTPKRAKKQQTRCRSPRKKFQPMSSNDVIISDFDALICGYFRLCLPTEEEEEQMRMDSMHRMPKEISDVIREYQRNIHYVEVNFVWTHKYACCSDQQHCQVLKDNRANYVFERNPFNNFDANAIKILTRSEQQVGHVPRDLASVLAPLLDQGKIELECVGGAKTRPCSEMVQIVARPPMSEDDWNSLYAYLETTPFDQNRYVDTKESNV
eukprot:CAMPEP_0202698168 /NCGR_PEP_ID=MMETSP1385-20130828/11443_1 /ASSEMBLY_ACC=CAM_ASM_000861 /TAXON_ID=933848 /ORGANISM="Elphidium margaritaceum" /LENGTH=336 /DNA_ID=CAMNT_0049354811 /DNA_START=69 /DNA_END=1079 /DNA_ORIENTATION=-